MAMNECTHKAEGKCPYEQEIKLPSQAEINAEKMIIQSFRNYKERNTDFEIPRRYKDNYLDPNNGIFYSGNYMTLPSGQIILAT